MQSRTFFRLSIALISLVSFFVLVVIGDNILRNMPPPQLPETGILATTSAPIQASNEAIPAPVPTATSVDTAAPAPQASAQPDSMITATIKAPKGTIYATIVATDADREKGLGGRTSLAPDAGMLFVFADPGSYGFWMKDMKFSLDLVWIASNKQVLGVAANVSPDTYPNEFDPPAPDQYVLELNSGAAAKFGIASGVKLVF